MSRKCFLMKKVLIIFVLFLLVGCVTSQDRKLFSPDFEGGVSPVTIPIQPKYIPCEYQYSDTTKLYGNDNKTNSPETTRTFGKIRIQKSEDNLLYKGTIDKTIIEGETFQGSLPIMDAQFLITSYGTVLKKEIIFPLFSKNSELHDQLLANIEKFSFLFSYLPTFPQHEITSGDYLISFALGDKRVGTKLKGYSYHKGKKVIVGEIDEAIPFKTIMKIIPQKILLEGMEEFRKQFAEKYGKLYSEELIKELYKDSFENEPDIIIKGYVLLDPDTFFQLKSVMAAKQNGNAIFKYIFEAENI